MTAIAAGAGKEARRTALILAASQAIVGSAAPIAISMGALAGQYLLGADKSLATAPVTGFNVGVAIGALPAAAIIRGMGQRGGFMTGTIVTALGGLIATLALYRGSFWLFAFGLVVIGVGGAFVQQFRFAAATMRRLSSRRAPSPSCWPAASSPPFSGRRSSSSPASCWRR